MANLSEALKTLNDVKKKVREAVKVNKAGIKKNEKEVEHFTEEAQANKDNLIKYVVRVFKARQCKNAIESLKEINSLFEAFLEKPSNDRLRKAVIAYHVLIKQNDDRDNDKEMQIFRDGFIEGISLAEKRLTVSK